MTLRIDPKFEQYIDEQIRAGRFSSADEMVEAGLARLMLDPEPDLDETEMADIRAALERTDRGEMVNSSEVHAKLKTKFGLSR